VGKVLVTRKIERPPRLPEDGEAEGNGRGGMRGRAAGTKSKR
jgi:hypothetical protein